jgi:hypothetical protein
MSTRERIDIKPDQAAVFTRPDGISLYVHLDGDDGLWVHALGAAGGPTPAVDFARNANNEGWLMVRPAAAIVPHPPIPRRRRSGDPVP